MERKPAKVKICGITNLEDALAAVEYGADALGFVFYAKSPRAVTVAQAAGIIKNLPPFIVTVGVFVNENPDLIDKALTCTGISIVQLHGDETVEICSRWPRVIKALRVRNAGDIEQVGNYPVVACLLDAYSPHAPGGTGEIFNWDIAVQARQHGRIILAGGLHPDNVAEAVEKVKPYGVDVSSGVEAHKGLKDHRAMRLFIARAKAAGWEE